MLIAVFIGLPIVICLWAAAIASIAFLASYMISLYKEFRPYHGDEEKCPSYNPLSSHRHSL